MNVLAFTTSTDDGSVALAQTGQATVVSRWTRTTQGSEILTYKIKLLLARVKLSLDAIDLIAVDKGPGSFTGCRIAVNVAKTMSMTLQKPLVGACSLDIMAQGALKNFITKQGGPRERSRLAKKNSVNFNGRIICLLDAHKSLFYTRWYDCQHSKIVEHAPTVQALSLEDIERLKRPELLLVGNIPEPFKSAQTRSLAGLLNVPQAALLAELALGASTIDWRALEPSYVRSPDAVEKLARATPTS